MIEDMKLLKERELNLGKKVDMDYRLLEKFCKTRPTQDLLKLGDD